MKGAPANTCPLCGGTKQVGKTTYSADLGVSVIVIRNVPASICGQCGEAWIDPATAKHLEVLTNEARAKGTQVEVVAL